MSVWPSQQHLVFCLLWACLRYLDKSLQGLINHMQLKALTDIQYYLIESEQHAGIPPCFKPVGRPKAGRHLL